MARGGNQADVHREHAASVAAGKIAAEKRRVLAEKAKAKAEAEALAYGQDQLRARSAATAQKMARRSSGSTAEDQDLQDKMYVGPGNSYDAWHAQTYGG